MIAKPDDSENLHGAERAILDAVISSKGIRGKPTEPQFADAIAELTAYADQVRDTPPDDSPPHVVTARWLSSLSDGEPIILVAAAWVRWLSAFRGRGWLEH